MSIETNIKNILIGNKNVKEIYSGNNLIFSKKLNYIELVKDGILNSKYSNLLLYTISGSDIKVYPQQDSGYVRIYWTSGGIDQTYNGCGTFAYLDFSSILDKLYDKYNIYINYVSRYSYRYDNPGANNFYLPDKYGAWSQTNQDNNASINTVIDFTTGTSATLLYTHNDGYFNTTVDFKIKDLYLTAIKE